MFYTTFCLAHTITELANLSHFYTYNADVSEISIDKTNRDAWQVFRILYLYI